MTPTMTDLSAPAIVVSTNGSFVASWSATDNKAVTGYQIRTKKGASGTWSGLTATTAVSRTFSGVAPGSWYIDVRASDAAGHWSAYREIRVVVPADDRSYVFSSYTARRTGSAYIGGTATSNARYGSKLTVKFKGDAFYLIGTVGRSEGKLRITIDGKSWTVDTGYYKGGRASTSHYRVVLFSKALSSRSHTVVITNLATSGRATIIVDALGFRN